VSLKGTVPRSERSEARGTVPGSPGTVPERSDGNVSGSGRPEPGTVPSRAPGAGRDSPKALLLDLDGTVADTLPDIAGAVNHVRAQLGWRSMPVAAVKVHVGDGVERLLADCTGLDQATVDLLVPKWRAYYLDHAVDGTTLLPGALALLEAARSLGLPLGLVTNKPLAPTERILEALGLRPFFGAVLGGDSLPTRKPDPAMIHEALRLLGGVPPAGAWLVGDGSQDVEAAKAAGCTSVLVAGYGDLRRARECGPDLEVADLGALLPLLG
jgi:phosphoglycolate phosphatase